MEHETDSDKLKVLRDKLFKLRAEIQRNSKKRKMLKGFIDKSNWDDDVKKISANESVDEKILDLSQRVHNDGHDSMRLHAVPEKDYLEEENKGLEKDLGDEKVFETTKSEASDSFPDEDKKESAHIQPTNSTTAKKDNKKEEVPLIKQMKDKK